MEAALLPQRGGGAPPCCVFGCRKPLESARWCGNDGGVKDSKSPGGGVSQPIIEGSGVPVLRMELVRAG